jgi:hypothetical protein
VTRAPLTERLPRYALYALIPGLALHNVVMAGLWDLGLRGAALDVVAAWKEALLVAAFAAVVWRRQGLPFKATWTDWLALAYGAVVVLWFLLPQDWLGGAASGRGELFALRHHLLPVAAYFLGRGLGLDEEHRRRVVVLVVGTAAAVAAIGLVDLYVGSLGWWRDSGVPGWYREQLGLDYGGGLSGLPENFIYNDGDEEPVRRLVSTFVSPLATAFLMVVALLAVATARRPRPLLAGGGALAFVALLYTYSRSALLALVVALVVAGFATRRLALVAAAAVVLVAGAGFVKVYPEFGPSTTFTPAELQIQRAHAAAHGEASGDPLDLGESSTSSHLTNLRDGLERVVEHPQGYGLGNAGVNAKRTGVDIKAGESTYTELGVDAGLLGLLLFVAWSLTLTSRVVRRSAWLGASLAAVLVLGIQTDVLGVPWLAYVLWTLAGDRS